MSLLLYTVLAGILFGLFYALVGLGLNLAFGVMRVVNLAHGDFLMLGGFGAYYAFTLLNWNPLYTLVGELAAFVLLGFPLYYLLVPRLLKSRDPEMLSFVLFFGLSQVIEAVAIIFFSNNQVSIFAPVFGTNPVTLFGQTFPVSWVVSAGVSAVLILALYVYLYRTRVGYATRAIMSSHEEAFSTGLNVHRISALAFGIGLALAAAAGVLSPFMLSSISPNMGVGITTTAFAIIIIGSLGNPIGTVIGGLVFGLSYMLMQSYLSSWADLLPFVLLLVIVLIRPTGLLGRAVRYV